MATAKSITSLPKISLVIPCFNESHRVQQLLDGLNEFDKNWNGNYEAIIVDDGSNDGTVEALRDSSFIQSHPENIKIISLDKNAGKGHALKEGVAAATGDYILTLDADMSTRPVELKTWLNLNKGQFPQHEIWIGSREHADSKITEVKSRKTMGRIFNLIVRFLTPLSQHDTQCGFKLYPAEVAKKLFSELKTSGWAHDVELLYHAHQDGIEIREMPVKWDTMSGSKLSPFKDAIKMFRQVLTVSIFMKWNYFVSTPLKSASDKNQNSGNEKNIIFRFLFFISAIILLIMMMSMSHQYGITGDEKVQKAYGEKVLSFYTSFGKDTSCLHYKNLYIYGGLFDGLCAAINKVQHFMDPYDMRHLLNSIFGFIAILFCGLLAKQLTKSWRAGWIALILLAVSPTFFGHCMNNPKDIPFAAAYIFSIYYLFKYIKEMPNPSLRTKILLIIGIATTINIRVGGLILIGMLGAFLTAEFILSKKFRSYFKTEKSFLSRLVKQFLIISVISYFAGLIFWPYGLSGPLSNPVGALSQFSKVSTSCHRIFRGITFRHGFQLQHRSLFCSQHFFISFPFHGSEKIFHCRFYYCSLLFVFFRGLIPLIRNPHCMMAGATCFLFIRRLW
jgi:glycosyltransferase involved in cell wall biosynthesis